LKSRRDILNDHFLKMKSDLKSVLIKQFKTGKYSIRDLTKLYNIPKSTIQDWIIKWKKTGLLENKPKIGRTKILTNYNLKQIKKMVTKDIKATPKQIKHSLNLKASTKTIKRRLKDLGFRRSIKRKKTPITQNQRESRLYFASLYSIWILKQWKTILWLDEAMVCFESNNTKWITRPFGRRNDPIYFEPKQKIKHSSW